MLDEKELEHKEDRYLTEDGLNVYFQVWRPGSAPKAIIQLVHGFAEHGSRYQNVVSALVPKGFAIYADDHRGHGKSDGDRGFIPRFDSFVQDQRTFTRLIREQEGDRVPLFLLGHSMGSIISIHYASKFPDQFKGIILSGTGTQAGETISKILIWMVRIFSRLRPKGRIDVGLSEAISRDPTVVEAYKNDPMIFSHITFRLGAEMSSAIAKLPTMISMIKLPILFQCGGADTLITGTEELFCHVTSPDKTLKIYNGLYHEVYNELEEDRTRVLSDLEEWLNKHL